MGAQRRRLKAAVHRREVERLLDVKRVAFEQQQVPCSGRVQSTSRA